MKKFYITTSIPYTNAPPHIGFALEIIQADVLARHHRSKGDDVFFLTGTDEHGLKIKKAAEAANKTPLEFASDISDKFRNLAKALNISNNDFIRTTDEKRHIPAMEKLWKAFEKTGDIYKKKYAGLYCQGCESFKTEKELVNGKCPIHNVKSELIEEENYFFRLSKYLPQIKDLIEKGEIKIIPETRKNEVLAMAEGLNDISFSREREKYWGIPVPGDPSQIIYVWGDALPNYISAIGYAKNTAQFKKYWPADVHCVGKDIIKFHALFWPAMLLSAGLKLPRTIFVHGFITVAGQKMSKSLGNVIDPFELVNKYGVDPLRYYLLREIPSIEDGDFTQERFLERYNSDLASGIGNLVSRVITLAEGLKFDKGDFKSAEIDVEIKKAWDAYNEALEKFRFHDALKSVFSLVSFCDGYVDREKPWERKENSKKVIGNLLAVLHNIARMLNPFLPETSEKIVSQLRVSLEEENPINFKVKKFAALFPKK